MSHLPKQSTDKYFIGPLVHHMYEIDSKLSCILSLFNSLGQLLNPKINVANLMYIRSLCYKRLGFYEIL